MFAADHEIVYEDPTLFWGYPKNTFLMLTGLYEPEKYLYVDKIPAAVSLVRVPVAEGVEAGVICYFRETAKIDLHIPSGIVNPVILKRAMLAALIKSLNLQQYNPILDGNELLFEIDGKKRKFCGFFSCKLGGWDYCAMPVTFQINYDLMRSVYRLDTLKMAEKGIVEDIGDVVVGVDEVVSGLDKDLFLDTFAQNLATRFGWELATGDFSVAERAELDKFSTILSASGWVQNAEYPSIK